MITDKDIIDEFHTLYYDPRARLGIPRPWRNVMWMGINVYQIPSDLIVIQEIVWETRPDIIIECGTASGGLTHYLAKICDMMNNGKVLSIDVSYSKKLPIHPRIKYLTGSTVDPNIIQSVSDNIEGKVMVILDSDHGEQHVTKEIESYSKFVTSGCYMIVCDGNVNGNPIEPNFGPGPQEAIQKFMLKDENKISWTIDKSKEIHLITFFPNGFIKRN